MSEHFTIEDLQALVGKTIVFTKEIENWEIYAEPNMKAIVQKYNFDEVRSSDPRDSVHRIYVDYEPFEAENHPKQNANYYDGNGNAVLTAVEAGYYNAQEWIYLDALKSIAPFKVVEV